MAAELNPVVNSPRRRADPIIAPDYPGSIANSTAATDPGWLGWQIDDGLTSRGKMNRGHKNAAAKQAQVAAEGAPVRVTYGRDRPGAQIALATAVGKTLYLLCVWGEGPIDAIEAIELDDAAPASGVTATHYLGTSTQTADPTLAAILPGYADALPNYAYSVVVVPAGANSGFPRVNATLRGRKLYDPRLDSTAGGTGSQRLATPSTWTWSENPVLALADFIYSTSYGMGEAVDWSTVITCANVCDATVGSGPAAEARRLIDLSLDQQMAADAWIAILRTYAGCFVVRGQNGYELIPDRPVGSYDMSIRHQDNLIAAGTFKWDRKSAKDSPTVIEIVYTDTTTKPWKNSSAFAYAAGALAGTAPWIVARVSMIGIQRYSQAAREATERLNHLTLEDLRMAFVMRDEGLKLKIAGVVTVDYPIGFVAKPMRVVGLQMQDAGRWAVSLAEYDPAAYSDSVESTPTFSDTSIPSLISPPAITGLTAVEENPQGTSFGLVQSRIRITWSNATYPHPLSYLVRVLNAANIVVDSISITEQLYVSIALPEGRDYTVEVTARTTAAAGTPSTKSVHLYGTATPPSDVQSCNGFELNGFVFLNWPTITPISDLRNYELRALKSPSVSAPNQAQVESDWQAATVLNRPLTNNWTDKGTLAAGSTYRCMVKAVNSMGVYSANAAYLDISVSVDTTAGFTASNTFASPTLTNVSKYTIRPLNQDYWVSDRGESWSFGHSDTNNTTGTFADLSTIPWAAPATTGVATFLTESWDLGTSYAGNFVASINWQILAGTPKVFIETSPDNSVWTQYAAVSCKSTGRYARIRVEGQSNDVFLINGLPTLRIIAPKIIEQVTATTVAGNFIPVPLTNRFNTIKSIQGTLVSPLGTIVPVPTQTFTSGGRGPLQTGQFISWVAGSTTTYYGKTASIPAAMSITGALTLEMWWNPLAMNTGASFYGLLLKGANRTGENWGLTYHGTNKSLQFAVTKSAGSARQTCTTANNVIANGRWVHIACVYNDTTMAIYLDGVLVASTTGITSGVLLTNASPVGVGGGASDACGTGYFKDIRLWNTARTQQQIVDNMNAVISSSATGLVAWWSCDQTPSNTPNTQLNDQTATACHLTLQNASTSAWYFWVRDGFLLYGSQNVAGSDANVAATFYIDVTGY